jgi:hypothetical protein
MLSQAMSSGTGAGGWGLWRQDPGPRGVRIQDVGNIVCAAPGQRGCTATGVAWFLDVDEWWLEAD